MAFTTILTIDPGPIKPGELVDGNNIVLTANTYENGLEVGRFAKLDSGSLDKLDASATPVIAGVVLRDKAMPLDSNTYDNTLMASVEYARAGLVAVEVKSGETPSLFGSVTVHNVADANAGTALADGSGVAVNAVFIQEISATTWIILLSGV